MNEPTPKLDKAERLRRIQEAHERLNVVTLEDEVERISEIETEPIPLDDIIISSD